MGDHDSEIMDGGSIDRGDAGALGVLPAGCEGRIGPLFAQERTAVSASLFLDGLLSDERRKTGWMRAVLRQAQDDGGRGPRSVAPAERARPRPLGGGRCATSCATTPWRRLPIRMRFWASMKPAS